MADFETDPDAMTEVAFALSAAADSGPEGALPPADGCGSPAVESLLADDDLDSAWQAARDTVVELGVGAVRAADAYRETDSRVAARADSEKKP